MRLSAAVIFLLAFAICRSTQGGNQKLSQDSTSVNKARASQAEISLPELRDTTVNGIKLRFTPVNRVGFYSVQSSLKKVQIPYTNFDYVLMKSEDCRLIKIENGTTDSLCDIHDKTGSGYFEEYSIRGLWKQKNCIVANFRDYENSADLLINLRNGSHYFLNDSYEVSPSLNFILGYNKAFVFGNEFTYSEITVDSVKTLFKIDFGQVVVSDLFWLSDTECVLSAGVVERGGTEFKKELYYLMSIEK